MKKVESKEFDFFLRDFTWTDYTDCNIEYQMLTCWLSFAYAHTVYRLIFFLYSIFTQIFLCDLPFRQIAALWVRLWNGRVIWAEPELRSGPEDIK